jgi:hypothetical protein
MALLFYEKQTFYRGKKLEAVDVSGVVAALLNPES